MWLIAWLVPSCATHGFCGVGFAGGSFAAKSESLARGEVMTITPTRNLDDVFFTVGCVLYLLCAESAGCDGFSLINPATLFFLINKNSILLPCFKRKNDHPFNFSRASSV